MKALRGKLSIQGVVLCLVGLGSASGHQGESVHPTRKPLRMELTRVTLGELCRVLTKRTGVPHRAADQPTGDLRANVLGQLSAADLRRALGLALRVQWREEDVSGRTGYVAGRTPQSVAEAERTLAETDQAFRHHLRERVGTAMLPDEAFQQLPSQQKVGLNSPISRYGMQVLGCLSSERQDRVLAGFSVSQSTDRLSPRGVEAVGSFLGALKDRMLIDEGPVGGPGWSIRVLPSAEESAPSNSAFWLQMAGTRPGSDFKLLISVPVPEPPGEDQNPSRLRHPEASADAIVRQEMQEQYRPQGETWEEIARSLSTRLGQALVSDAYTLPLGRNTPDRQRLPVVVPGERLAEYLDRACKSGWYRRWTALGGTLVFQRRDWARCRRREIPRSQVHRWRRHMIEVGRRSIDHLQEMAGLSPHQLPSLDVALGESSGGLPICLELIADHWPILIVRAQVTESLRERMGLEFVGVQAFPVGLKPLVMEVGAALLPPESLPLLSRMRLRAPAAQETFEYSVAAAETPPVSRRLDMRLLPGVVKQLKQVEQIHEAALKAAEDEPPG